MGLGDYRFSLDTAAYQALQRTTSWRWPVQERIGTRPALQFTGPGTDEIELQGLIYPHFRGGLGQLDAMRAEGDTGEPRILVDGRGAVLGKFVIQRVVERQRQFDAAGVPRRIEFSLTLSRYGDDE